MRGHKPDKKASVIYDQLQRRQVPDKYQISISFSDL